MLSGVLPVFLSKSNLMDLIFFFFQILNPIHLSLVNFFLCLHFLSRDSEKEEKQRMKKKKKIVKGVHSEFQCGGARKMYKTFRRHSTKDDENY